MCLCSHDPSSWLQCCPHVRALWGLLCLRRAARRPLHPICQGMRLSNNVFHHALCMSEIQAPGPSQNLCNHQLSALERDCAAFRAIQRPISSEQAPQDSDGLHIHGRTSSLQHIMTKSTAHRANHASAPARLSRACSNSSACIWVVTRLVQAMTEHCRC